MNTVLKPQTILIFSGLVFWPLLEKGYAANPIDVCRKGVSSVVRLFSMSAEERETITQDITGRLKTMLGEEIRGLSPELAQRMDEVFYREVGKKLASLEPRQLRMMKKSVMRNQSFSSSYGLVHALAIKPIFRYYPAIVFNPNFPLYHPHRRIALIHELEHILDFISGRDVDPTMASMLRGEANAHIAEYQYITKVFNSQDLKDLERDFPGLSWDFVERMRAFYPFPQHTNNGVFIPGMSIKEAIDRFINNDFVERVRTALALEQDTYVERVLRQYRK